MRNMGLWVVLGFIGASLLTPSLPAQERWVYQYNMEPHGLDDEARSIVIGPDGSVYAAGRSETEGWDSDFTIVKLTSSGDPVWVYHYNSPGDGEDWLSSILMDTDGNLYAAGSTEENVGSYAFTVIRLDTAGTDRWIHSYGPGYGTSIVKGTDGNLYAAGSRGRPPYPYLEFAVIGLDTSGVEQWGYRHYGRGRAEWIEMGPDGNLYAGGISWKDGGPDAGFTVISLTSLGGERWVYQLDGDGDAYSVVMGTDGNIYAAGYSTGIGGTSDFTVLSLTLSGDSIWAYQYDGPGQGWADCGFSIAEGPDSNLYVAGMSEGEETAGDFTVVKLTGPGKECWIRRYPPIEPAPEYDVARSIAIGVDGTVYAAGTCHDDTMMLETRFTVISLSPSGDERWVYYYGLPGLEINGHGAHSIMAGTDGNLYAAGASQTVATHYDFTVVSLEGSVGVEERQEARGTPSTSRGERLRLMVSPTPAVRGVKIGYFLPKAEEVRLSIYDVSGNLVRTLVNTNERAGSRVAAWECEDSQGERVPSGTYFVRLQTTDVCASQKLIVFR